MGRAQGEISSPDGVSTRKDSVHYVFAMQYNADRVYLDHVPAGITRAYSAQGGARH